MKTKGTLKRKQVCHKAFLLPIILLFLGFVATAQAGVFKWIRIGNMHGAIFDSGDMSRPLGSYNQFYYHGRRWSENIAWRLMVRDWTDDKGQKWAYKTSGTDVYGADEQFNIMPIEVDGYTIKRYVRFHPPSIKVQGANIDPFFPLPGDEVNPDYIDASGGNGADQLVESWIQTAVGITIHQKVYAFSQKNHNDYIIYDWTLKNTTGTYTTPGGVTVNLPVQTLNGLYLGLEGWFNQDTGNLGWSSTYGEHPGDSLRIAYNYPAWNRNQTYDTFGNPNPVTGFIREPSYVGWAILHTDASPTNPANDHGKLHMTASGLQKYTTAAQHDPLDPVVCEIEYLKLI